MMAAGKLRHNKWFSMRDKPGHGVHTDEHNTHVLLHTYADNRPLCVHFPPSKRLLSSPVNLTNPSGIYYGEAATLFFFSPSTERSIINKLSDGNDGPEGGLSCTVYLCVSTHACAHLCLHVLYVSLHDCDRCICNDCDRCICIVLK